MGRSSGRNFLYVGVRNVIRVNLGDETGHIELSLSEWFSPKVDRYD
jgi:hypothetical protein